MITNFEFDLAYEGQIPKPTAAITMSKWLSCKNEFFERVVFFFQLDFRAGGQYATKDSTRPEEVVIVLQIGY